MIRTEVEVLKRIQTMDHPHLLQFLGLFEDPEKVVLVLEFLAGRVVVVVMMDGLIELGSRHRRRL